MAKENLAAKPSDQFLRLVQQVSLQDLRLVACHCKLGAQPSPPPSDVAQKINVQTSEVESDGKRHLVCVITLTISDIPAGVDPATNQGGVGAMFIIEGSFHLAYAVASAEEISRELMQEFGQRNALHNVWPYWREFVQSMTTRMGLPPLRVPLMRPGDLKFKQDGNEKTTAAKRKGRKDRKR